ncbi:3'-5' exonuclease [uncultured Zhongshania sp.]|uniref:DEAD/DEAH box helicase n=1 Tax=uncultured Zhongshania sp. TaxID=1642288 RepID=UPI0025F327CD|nr:3'-5' exonuclease [uncultured Zhongshania sp.]
MAALIPPISSCLSRMTSGEKRVARRLESLLEDDYLCWYDIPLGDKRRYPDFVILHPARGLLFLEVKDWKPETLKKLTKTEVEILTANGRKWVANPLEQARQCSYQVLKILERDPQLLQQTEKYQGRLCFPYGWGVVLTNISRSTLERGIPEHLRATALPDHLVICKDEMTESVDPEVFQQHLWNMFNYRFGEKLSLPQIDRIRWHLFPEIRIDSEQMGLFEAQLDSALPEAQVNIPDIVRIMDLQQEQLARSLGDGHRVIHGVAGSGKTLILGFRCLHLAQALNKPILVLCFNITLAARLRSFMYARGIDDKVQIYHFHDWCNEMLRAYHLSAVEGDEPVWERQVSAVIQGVEAGSIPRGQYGALLIDEGHDFEPEWLKLVTQMVDPETNSLLLLYDDAQSIYRKKSSLKFTLASVGIQAQGRTTILRLNYRNTREIIEFSYRFAKAYFEQSEDPDIPLVEPEAAGRSGPDPMVKQSGSLALEIDFTLRCLKNWQGKGKSWKDIAILYPGGSAGLKMAEALKASGIPHLLLKSSQNKKLYDDSIDRINIMPIPSSKGLEFDTVVILDASFVPKRDQDSDVLTEDARRLYVGMTRAQQALLISYHRENVLAKAFCMNGGAG